MPSTLRAVRMWSGLVGEEVHEYVLRKVPFQMGIERYVATRHLQSTREVYGTDEKGIEAV